MRIQIGHRKEINNCNLKKKHKYIINIPRLLITECKSILERSFSGLRGRISSLKYLRWRTFIVSPFSKKPRLGKVCGKVFFMIPRVAQRSWGTFHRGKVQFLARLSKHIASRDYYISRSFLSKHLRPQVHLLEPRSCTSFLSPRFYSHCHQTNFYLTSVLLFSPW